MYFERFIELSLPIHAKYLNNRTKSLEKKYITLIVPIDESSRGFVISYSKFYLFAKMKFTVKNQLLIGKL